MALNIILNYQERSQDFIRFNFAQDADIVLMTPRKHANFKYFAILLSMLLHTGAVSGVLGFTASV